MDGHVIVHPRLEDLPKEETPENEGGNNGGSEHPHPQPQPEAPERGNLVNEEINEDLRDMALENLDENQAARRGENQDSNFDSLKDLKALKEKNRTKMAKTTILIMPAMQMRRWKRFSKPEKGIFTRQLCWQRDWRGTNPTHWPAAGSLVL